MKVVIPWVCVFALCVGCFYLFSQTKEDEKQLASLKQDSEELSRLRAENTELRKLQVEHAEVVQLRNDHEELLRLRGEVGPLRKQNKELLAQLQMARAQSSLAMQQQHKTSELTTENQNLRSQFEKLAADRAAANMVTCIKNLQRIDDTKALWAKDAQKPPGSVPTMAELATYFPNGVFPACPDGGVYSINALGFQPTCSTPGHVMPK